jgi:hypothetical protein
MARAGRVQHTDPSPSSLILPTGEERSAGCTNGTSNSQTSVTQPSVNGSAGLQSNIQQLSDRLHTLHELYENRNQVNYNSHFQIGNFHTVSHLMYSIPNLRVYSPDVTCLHLGNLLPSYLCQLVA